MPNITPINEEVLWRNFKCGDEQAFAQIYHTYFQALYTYASKFSPDKDLVKDCIHDLFIDLWDKRQNLKELLSIKYYLFRAIRNTMLDALRDRKKIVFEYGQDLERSFEFVFSHEAELIDQQFMHEQKQRIVEALNELTPRQKEAVFLRFFHEFSYEDIAAVMMLGVDSAYNLISKALRVMRLHLVQSRSPMPMHVVLSLLATVLLQAELLAS
ncbi:MAG: sigma-70 family RNA polymerase sigma factor [Bacteroidota bacterium]